MAQEGDKVLHRSASSSSSACDDENRMLEGTVQSVVTVSRGVVWPPSEEGIRSSSSGKAMAMSVATSKYLKNLDSNFASNSDPHQPLEQHMYTGVFRPGKLNPGERWRGQDRQGEEHPHQQEGQGRVKMSLKTMDDVIMRNSVPTKHSSYHVPPGTQRTRKAQHNYTKHLEVIANKDESSSNHADP